MRNAAPLILLACVLHSLAWIAVLAAVWDARRTHPEDPTQSKLLDVALYLWVLLIFLSGIVLFVASVLIVLNRMRGYP